MTVFRDNREPDPGLQDAVQIAEMANLTTKTPPVGVGPSVSNEQWLADSINELKTKDAEYLRLQSEQAREQWENMTRENLRRQRAVESNQAEHTQLQLAQRDATDAKHNSELFQYADELSNRLRIEFPNGYTSQTLPIDTLADIVRTNQRFQKAAELAGVESREGGVIPIDWNPKDSQPSQQGASPQATQRPETFLDGSLYQLTSNDDGTIQVKLITGEIFKGEPQDVMQQMARAQVNTKRWAQQQREQAQQHTIHPQSQSQAGGNGNGTAAPVPDSTNGNGEVPSFGEWAADEQARALGFSDRNELLQWGNNINQTISRTNEFMEQQKLRAVTADFMARNQDFPGTPEAIEALTVMVAKNGWDPTAENYEVAHNHLVRTRAYAPLTPEQPQRNRLAPPPMIRSDAPDATNRDLDLWTEPLAAQRARIIREQLAQKGL
jgi:hypothetical protein